MKKYYIRNETPLTFHKFFWYFCIPVGILLDCIITLPRIFSPEYYSVKGIFWISLIYLVSTVLLRICAFIGFFKWKTYAYHCILIYVVLHTGFRFIVQVLNGEYTSSIYLLINILIFIYYYKRKALFFSEPQKNKMDAMDDDFLNKTKKDYQAISETKIENMQNKNTRSDKEENMIERSFISYKCTHCGIVYMANYYPVIYQGNPQIDEKVKNGTIFETRCPNCGNIATLIYPCIYIDESRKYAVTLQQVYEDEDKETIRKGFPDDYIITFTTDTISFVGTVNVLSSKPIVALNTSKKQNEDTGMDYIRYSTKNEVSSNNKKWIKIILLVGVLIVATTSIINIISQTPYGSDYSENKTTEADNYNYDPDANLAAFEYPVSGKILYESGESRICPLSIVTESTDINAHYVKLIDSNGNTVLSTFIRPGEGIEIEAPVGTYRLRYASGETWYGEEYFFGANTRYAEADSPLYFYTDDSGAHGYTVELYNQINGNLGEEILNKSEF